MNGGYRNGAGIPSWNGFETVTIVKEALAQRRIR